jgi:hypothetical protein
MATSKVQGEETEATPEMIEAGVRVLYASGAIETSINSADYLLVGEIYKAMRVEWMRCCKSKSLGTI